jgi:hypothetical protein
LELGRMYRDEADSRAIESVRVDVSQIHRNARSVPT